MAVRNIIKDADPVSAPNAAVGQPFNYGITSFAAVPGLDSRGNGHAALGQQAPAGADAVADILSDRLRSLLASDVYSSQGRLRADDILVRERVGRGLGEASARLRELISRWWADRVPPSTREQPFPPAEVIEPIRKGRRLCRAIEDAFSVVRGLPVLNADRVWDRLRGVGLEELMQFDWALVGESDGLSADLADAVELDTVDAAAVEGRLCRIRELVGERGRYLEIQA
jgi:hypothetical protein